MKLATTLALCLYAVGTLNAQQPNQQQGQIPQIVTSGTGETKVTPDRARIDLAVETRGATAAAAGAENARIQTAVLARLRSLGLTNQQLTTWGYTVYPEYQYSQTTNRPRIVGYVARNTVRADVHRIDQVGPAIDAALAAGANNIGGLDFYSSNTDAARQSALQQAVQKARTDAEAMASAAGGTLGTLLELTSTSYEAPPPRPYMTRMDVSTAQAESTPINPGEQSLTVSVTGRWRFVPR